MRVIPGGKPGGPDPLDRDRKRPDDGLDDLFADLAPKPVAEPARDPAPCRGWDVVSDGARAADPLAETPAEDDEPEDPSRAQL